jgi:hypothetical protein
MDAPGDNFDARDGGGRHPQDRALRRHGFAIHSRPRKGPALWAKGGKVYTEAEALEAAGITVVGRVVHDG